LKKALCALIALMMIISFAACNKASETPPVVSGTEQPGASESTTETEPPTVTTEPMETTAPQTDAPTTATTAPTTEPPTTQPTTETTTEPTTPPPTSSPTTTPPVTTQLPATQVPTTQTPTQPPVITTLPNIRVEIPSLNIRLIANSTTDVQQNTDRIFICASHLSGISELKYSIGGETHTVKNAEQWKNISADIRLADLGKTELKVWAIAFDGTESSAHTYTFNVKTWWAMLPGTSFAKTGFDNSTPITASTTAAFQKALYDKYGIMAVNYENSLSDDNFLTYLIEIDKFITRMPKTFIYKWLDRITDAPIGRVIALNGNYGWPYRITFGWDTIRFNFLGADYAVNDFMMINPFSSPVTRALLADNEYNIMMECFGYGGTLGSNFDFGSDKGFLKNYENIINLVGRDYILYYGEVPHENQALRMSAKVFDIVCDILCIPEDMLQILADESMDTKEKMIIEYVYYKMVTSVDYLQGFEKNFNIIPKGYVFKTNLFDSLRHLF